jgi:hypothetical protein
MADTALSAQTRRPHAVRFYENDKSLAQIVAGFLADGFAANEPGIVVATPDQRAALVRQLVVKGLDVVELQRSGQLTLLDAEETLSTFMVDGEPDSISFAIRMSEVVRRACGGTVRIFGQMVDVLWQRGQHDAAIRLEVLWNELAHTEAFSLLCGYAIGHFYKDANFDAVCAQHSQVVGADGRVA